MISYSSTPRSTDLAILSFSTLILDNLKINKNFELNLHKNLFRKFYYINLISLLDNAFSAKPDSYKSYDLLILSALYFLGL